MKTSIIASLALALVAAPAFADDDDDDRKGRGGGVPPGLIGKIDLDDDLDLDDIGEIAGQLNGQLNLAAVNATLDATVTDIGIVSLTAAAIGNSLSATANGAGNGLGSLFEDGQGNFANITAKLDASVESTDQKVDAAQREISATAAAIGNSATLSVDGVENGVQKKLAQVNTGLIGSTATIAAGSAQSAVSATAAAIGNSLSVVNGVIQ
jgi:hypothetical protein